MSDKNETVDNDSEDLAATLASLQAQLDKVNKKNKELIAEKQAAKQAAQDALDEADNAKSSAAEKKGDIEALKALHAKELKKAQDVLAERDTSLRKITLDNEIANGLTANNVRPELARAVTAMMKAEAEYANGTATIGGQPIADYMKEFLSGADGAHFVRASDNSGGGATGSTTTKANLANKEFNLSEYSAMRKTDPDTAAAWATATGNGELNAI